AFTSGDPNYTNASSVQTAFTISPDPTSVSVSASNTAPGYGQSVMFTATITSATGATPTVSDGTVTFYDGTKLLAPADLAGRPAIATVSTAALAAGSHPITARYSGDTNFVASQSGVEPTTVPTVLATGLSNPQAVAVNSQGDVFIADIGNHRVLE